MRDEDLGQRWLVAERDRESQHRPGEPGDRHGDRRGLRVGQVARLEPDGVGKPVDPVGFAAQESLADQRPADDASAVRRLGEQIVGVGEVAPGQHFADGVAVPQLLQADDVGVRASLSCRAVHETFLSNSSLVHGFWPGFMATTGQLEVVTD